MRILLRSSVLGLLLTAAGTLAPTAALADAFVLVHGAWHDGSAWDGVKSELEAAGHTVVAPSMPGRGNNATPASQIEQSDYVAAIETAVTDLNEASGEPVTLVAHSSAGFLVQMAAPKFAKRLEQIVLTQAFILPDGVAQTDTIPPEVAAGLKAAAEANDGAVPPDEGFVRGALISNNTKEEKDRVLSMLVPEPYALFATPVDAKAFAQINVPIANIRSTADTSLPAAAYAAMAEAAGAKNEVALEGGHEALVLRPETFADALLEVSADD